MSVVSEADNGTPRSDTAHMSAACAEFLEACRDGLIEKVSALCDSSEVDVHFDEDKGFRVACQNGHVTVVERLLDLQGTRAVDVHALDERGFRLACQNGHVGVVKLLLSLTGARAIDVHAGNQVGLRAACQNGHLGVVVELLQLDGERRMDLVADRCAPVRLARKKGHYEILRQLLKRIPRDVQRLKDVYWLVCDTDDKAQLEDLLSFEDTCDEELEIGTLIQACETAKPNVLSTLLSLHGLNTAAIEAGLAAAVENGHAEIAKQLLEWKDPTDPAIGHDDWPPLLAAKQQGHAAMEVALRDFQIRVCGSNAQRFLLACREGDEDLLKSSWSDELIESGDAVKGCEVACGAGYVGIVRVLRGMLGDSAAAVDAGLLSAAGGGHMGVVELLLEWPCIHQVVSSGSGMTLALQIANGCDSAGMARLLASHVCKHAHSDMVKACTTGDTQLLQHCLAYSRVGVRIHGTPLQLQEGLTIACREGQLEVVRLLLGLTFDGQQARDMIAAGEEALRIASSTGHLAVVRELIAADTHHTMNISAPDKPKETAVALAAHGGHSDVLAELLKTQDERAAAVLGNLQDALWSACGRRGALKEVQLLLSFALERGIDLEHNPRMPDTTAFSLACGSDVEIVKALLELTGDHAVDVHAKGNLPCISACQSPDDTAIEVLRVLLSLEGDRYIDVNADSEAMFRVACQSGCIELIKEFLSLTGSREVDTQTVYRVNAADHVWPDYYFDVLVELAKLSGRRQFPDNFRERIFARACATDELGKVQQMLSWEGEQAVDLDFMSDDIPSGPAAACEAGCDDIASILFSVVKPTRVIFTTAVRELLKRSVSMSYMMPDDIAAAYSVLSSELQRCGELPSRGGEAEQQAVQAIMMHLVQLENPPHDTMSPGLFDWTVSVESHRDIYALFLEEERTVLDELSFCLGTAWFEDTKGAGASWFQNLLPVSLAWTFRCAVFRETGPAFDGVRQLFVKASMIEFDENDREALRNPLRALGYMLRAVSWVGLSMPWSHREDEEGGCSQTGLPNEFTRHGRREMLLHRVQARRSVDTAK